MRVLPTTLGLELRSMQPLSYKLSHRTCKDCKCTIDVFENKFRQITRKFRLIFFEIKLESYILCEPCYRESKINTIIKK